MRVLDVGCGAGDLSRMIAGLVGPHGEVVGIDLSDPALALARGTGAGPHSASVEYRRADLAGDLPDLGRFDAIVGRRVLMYLPDPAATLARLAVLARPGAIVAFQEHARVDLALRSGELALHRQLYDWIWDTVVAEGGDVKLGLRLAELMQAAGFTIKDERHEDVVLPPTEPSFLPTLVGAMLQRVIERGVATAAEVDLDTLAERIDRERRAFGGAIVWDLAVLASARAHTGRG